MRGLALILLVLLFVVRYDFWWWSDSQLVFGLPIGLAYHVGFCFAVTGMMALVVRFAWPKGIDDPAGGVNGPNGDPLT